MTSYDLIIVRNGVWMQFWAIWGCFTDFWSDFHKISKIEFNKIMDFERFQKNLKIPDFFKLDFWYFLKIAPKVSKSTPNGSKVHPNTISNNYNATWGRFMHFWMISKFSNFFASGPPPRSSKEHCTVRVSQSLEISISRSKILKH